MSRIIAICLEGFVTGGRRKSGLLPMVGRAQERLWPADDADVDLAMLVVNQRR
ncbi:hypothetical protein [Pseudomonas sp. PICF141]|uniref:hypothetical protein n=1 Tax=Pseudomonas sp. PICF141 TaxID=1949067 RepID=UPI00143CFFAC|nr:hypothetical protein [Pseudomonas sp. PICF141]